MIYSKKNLLLGVVSLLIGVGFSQLYNYSTRGVMGSAVSTQPDILYWVAPMDPNYRKTKPGLSPMGMELIPVYGEGEVRAGEVLVAPSVVNNLGVRTAQARTQALQGVINTVGYVQYDEHRLVHIHPRVEGWVDKLFVKAAGDPVSKGQPLYELYSPQLVNAQEEFLQATRSNNSRLVRAAKNKLRALNLDENTIEKLASTNVVQQTVTFFSPQSGAVNKLNIREGYFVIPGTTMMSIGALDEVWVEAEVFERQVSFVEVGQAVTMHLGYAPGKIWHGQVDYVYPALNAKTRTARVRVRFKNVDGALKPNMFASVEIHIKGTDEHVLVPREAVVRTGRQDRVVLALGGGRYKSVAVKLGRFDDKFAEVLDGVESGEAVVVSAQFLLDSESSKTSDFKRMDNKPNAKGNTSEVMNVVSTEHNVASASVTGVIESIDHVSRTASVYRSAIPKWNREALSVGFSFSPELDISHLNTGASFGFTFEIRDDAFVIVALDLDDSEVGAHQ